MQYLCSRHLRCDLNSCDDNLFSILHMVRIIYICIHKPVIWQGSNVSLIFSCESLPEGQHDDCCPVYSTTQQNRGNPTKASGKLNLQISRSLSKSLRQLLPRQRCQKSLLVIVNAHRKFRKRTDTVIAFTREYSRVSYLSTRK
jgi:hypothetical protein